MIKVVFKNLEKSQLAIEITKDYIETVIGRFPDLRGAKITMTLGMHNSPIQAGPDLFSAKFQCRSGKYKGVILKKEAENLYKALSELTDNLQERLNRFGEKDRDIKIKRARNFKKNLNTQHMEEQDKFVS